MEDYTNISAYLIGNLTIFFAVFAIYFLFIRKYKTRFQTVLGWIMAIWSLSNLKDIILTFPGMYTSEVLNWMMIIDGWGALTYTVFIFEAVMPGWTTTSRLSLQALPFAVFTLLYFIYPAQEVIYCYSVFLWFYAWTIVVIGWKKARRYIKYVRENYSNIDHVDASWLKTVFFFAIISQLMWLFTSLAGTITTDIVYYISTFVLWLMVLHYSWDFHPVLVDKTVDPATNNKNIVPFAKGALEELVEQQKLYLKKDLTLSDLSTAMNSNRTYVSKYLSQVLGMTFYDYINQLRIERVSIPMIQEHPEYKLDYVAQESGFASISTFRRAFFKLTGQTPSQYEAAGT